MAQDVSFAWDMDSLNKAYRQGYMAGVMGPDQRKCPYTQLQGQTEYTQDFEVFLSLTTALLDCRYHCFVPCCIPFFI